MKALHLAAAVIVSMATGCLFDGDNLRLEGAHYQYVVSELQIPSNNITARSYGLDINGDKTVDNQLGMVFATLNQQGLGVGDTAREALLRGGLVMLVDLQTTSFEETALSGLVTYLGGDPSPTPCLDPARLETCGQHLLGQGQFSVDDASASDHATGPIVAGVYLDPVGLLPVEIAIDPTSPIRLDLHGAHIRLTQLSEGHATGIIGGGITKADIDRIVIPEAAAQMNRIVTTECPKPGGVTPCGCLASSSAQVLQKYFDDNDDCQVGVAEVATNGIVQSLLAPDVTIGGEKLLSFGAGIELARATFTSPTTE